MIQDVNLEGSDVAQVHAVVFPWFTELVGLIVFFVLTRTVTVLPYTAVMFLIGLFMGIGAQRSSREDQLDESILKWSNIDSEVLFLVFLPGLMFRDAFNVDVHLFTIAVWQILTFAFPMVLAGTCLTALVGFYIFPYGWSFNLSMTVGSILSATDPVAVAALLNEVGAPPRLKLHISGESMFNDGSAIVFYRIFSDRFLNELGIAGLGSDVGLAEGVSMFFLAAGGGALLGVGFALALTLILFSLDRGLNTENNVVQVAATVTMAYLSFYVAEVVCEASGVICVVCLGITTRAYAKGLINDPEMLESFWVLLEHLLNTLLFSLGGVVWGRILVEQSYADRFGGKDWGYLFVLYILLMVIRAFLFLVFYPLTYNIGLSTNWQETAFLVHAGLRGAVGIALAISLDNDVRSNTEDPEKLSYPNKVFGMVGGVAFLTLIVNGSTAGPLLSYFGLTKFTETRKKILDHYEQSLRILMIQEYARILEDPRFSMCSIRLIKDHVQFLNDVTDDELEDAITKVQLDNPTGTASRLDPYASKDFNSNKIGRRNSSLFLNTSNLSKATTELRLIFLELLSAAYERARRLGHLDARKSNGFVYYNLKRSIEFAQSAVNRGEPLRDWEFSQKFRRATTTKLRRLIGDVGHCALGKGQGHSLEFAQMRSDILRALAFAQAHQWAQARLEVEFISGSIDLVESARIVLEESKTEVLESEEEIARFSVDDRKIVMSHYVCTILLNKAAQVVRNHTKAGLLAAKEAQHYLESIEESLGEIRVCPISHTHTEDGETAVSVEPVPEEQLNASETK